MTDRHSSGPSPAQPYQSARQWLHGVMPVLTTPFGEDDALDAESFRRVVQDVCDLGVNAVMFPGFGSEHWKLSDTEKDELVQVARQVTAASGVKLIASVCDEATELAKRRARLYQRVGADALNLLPPRLGGVSRRAALEHIAAVVAATPELAVIAQFVPGEGGVPLDPTDFAKLAERCPNVVAVKVESVPASRYVAALKQVCPSLLALVGNAGGEMLRARALGADGVQPGSGFAGVYVEIWQRYESGDQAGARELFGRLLEYLVGWSGGGRSAAIGKEIAKRRGVITCARSRQPGPVLDDLTLAEVDRFCAEFAPYLADRTMPQQVAHVG